MQGVAPPDQEHGQHKEEKERGGGRTCGLDKGKRDQLIMQLKVNIYVKLVFGECIVHFSEYIYN